MESSQTLFQALPKPVEELLQDQALLIQMLEANGVSGVTAIEMGGKIEGSTQILQKAALACAEGPEKYVLFKYNVGGTEAAQQKKQWREAYFYKEIYQKHLTEVDFACPKVHFALIDEEKASQLICMDYIEN